MQIMNRGHRELTVIVIMIIIIVSMMSIFVVGDPTGATVTYVQNVSKNASAPDSRSDDKGNIITITMDAEQQDNKWKAYVGNVSSSFVLDDEDDYSIYQWSISSFTGQVYITRNDSVTWSGIGCASDANKEAEDIRVNHTSTSEDSVNSTFVLQAHKQFSVGATTINQDSCYSIATWANDTVQTPSDTQPFVEVLLWSTDNHMIYTTFVENDASGYRSDGTPGTTYDFQAIVPDDAGPSEPAETYYFYIELLSN